MAKVLISGRDPVHCSWSPLSHSSLLVLSLHHLRFPERSHNRDPKEGAWGIYIHLYTSLSTFPAGESGQA